MFNIEQLSGHLGNIFFFIGAIRTAQAKRDLFIYQILGNVGYVIQSILMDNISLLILSIVLILINIFGWNNWKNNEIKNT